MDSEYTLNRSKLKAGTDKQQINLRIVGIGASAGGLEVLRGALVYRCRRYLQSVEGASWPVEIGGKPHVVTPGISPLEPGQKSLLLVSFLTAPRAEGKTIEGIIETTERESLIIVAISALPYTNDPINPLASTFMQNTNATLQAEDGAEFDVNAPGLGTLNRLHSSNDSRPAGDP